MPRINGRNRCSICGAVGVNARTHEPGMTKEEHEAIAQAKIHRPSVAGQGRSWGSLQAWTEAPQEPTVEVVVGRTIEERLSDIEATVVEVHNMVMLLSHHLGCIDLRLDNLNRYG